MASKQNLDAGGLMPLQRTQPPLLRNYRLFSPRLAMHGMYYVGRRGENFVRPRPEHIGPMLNDSRRTRPPEPHDKVEPCHPYNVSNEIGRQIIFVVPAATCDRATPFNAR